MDSRTRWVTGWASLIIKLSKIGYEVSQSISRLRQKNKKIIGGSEMVNIIFFITMIPTTFLAMLWLSNEMIKEFKKFSE